MNKFPGAFLAISSSLIFMIGCSRSVTTPPTVSSDRAITAFVVKAADNPTVLTTDVTATITSDTINLVFEKGANLTSLIPTISFTGKTISPASKASQNFDTTLIYTVTAQDGSTKMYPVAVSFVSGNKNITGFTFRAADNANNLSADVAGTIGTDTITVTVPYATKLTALVPFITTTGKTISPASLNQEDFSNPLKYTVTATDGSAKSYLVIVTVAPSLVAGTIFVAGSTPALNPNSTGALFAIDAASGKIKWSYLDNNPIFSAPTAANSIVYDLDQGGNLLAVDQNTGSARWSDLIGPKYNEQSNPTIANGILYVGTNDTSLYALDASTGTVDWKINVGAGSATVVNGVVYFASFQMLYAVNSSTGAVIWAVSPTTDTDAGFPGNPAVANGIVYFGCTDNYIYALDVANGNVKWKYNTGDVVDFSPTVVNGILYSTGGINSLHALDAATGAVKWTFPGPPVPSSPIVANGMVYFGIGPQYVYALDANTGSLKWMTDVGVGPEYSPLYFNGTIFISVVDKFYSINATTGAINWSVSTSPYWLTNPCLVDTSGNVYATADAGSQN